MDIIFYLFPLFIPILLYYNKQISFIDIVPLFYFYFDIFDVFVSHSPTFLYLEYFVILFYFIYYLFKKNFGKLIYGFNSYYFLIISLLIVPILQGSSINEVIRNFALNLASIIILPLSFSYFSKQNNLKYIYLSTFILITFYVIFVLFATPLKLGGERSEFVAGTTFYFGHLAARGGITYIAFVILLIPILFSNLKILNKIIIIISTITIVIFFLSVLKRFVFVILLIGVANYFFRPSMKMKYKFSIVLVGSILSIILLTNEFVLRTTENRYLERGADRKFSQESVESDIRIFEPYYVTKTILEKKSFFEVAFGQFNTFTFDIEHNNVFEERKIHNYYAYLISTSGFLGLALYLTIFFNYYRIVRMYYKKLKMINNSYLKYWIIIQNLTFIFFIAGMVGGHVHVSLRGLVFLYMGAIGGYLYSEYQKHILSKPENQVQSFQTFH